MYICGCARGGKVIASVVQGRGYPVLDDVWLIEFEVRREEKEQK